jgi:hypothetical protein
MVTTDEKINLDTLEKIESANRVKKHESMEEYAGRPLSPKEVDEMWEKIQENKKKDEAIMKKETQSRARAKNKAFPMGKKYGGIVKMVGQFHQSIKVFLNYQNQYKKKLIHH